MTDTRINTASTTTISNEIYGGLNQVSKFIPSKYFYDEHGSQLFERICELDEYYVTRVEMEIMNYQLSKLSSLKKKKLLVIELGSGSTNKIRCLLNNFHNIQSYLPIDISGGYLKTQTEKLKSNYRNLEVQMLAADYTQSFVLPKLENNFEEILIYYPGSSIGNFEPMQAKVILQRIINSIKNQYPSRSLKMLIGADLVKDPRILYEAYNDSQGITAKFNLNILNNLNNIAGTDFRLNRWSHMAFYNTYHKRIEMHLISSREQKVTIGDREIMILHGENIRTEYSYKYTVEDFSELFEPVFKLERCLTDDNNYFGLFLFNSL